MSVSQTLEGAEDSAGTGSTVLEVPRLLAETTSAATAGWRGVATLAEDAVVAVLARRAGLSYIAGMRSALADREADDPSLGTDTTLSEAAPFSLTGEKRRVARSESGQYVVLARRGTELALATAQEDEPGLEVKAGPVDAFGLERVQVTFSECRVQAVRPIDSDVVEEAHSLGALVVAAAAVGRLRILMEAAGAAARAIGPERSPLRHQDGQFAVADIWRDAAAAGRLVARAGDLVAERGWADQAVREAAWVGTIAATEALVEAANGLLRVFGHDAERIPGLPAELLAAHNACAAFVANRQLRLRIAALRGMAA